MKNKSDSHAYMDVWWREQEWTVEYVVENINVARQLMLSQPHRHTHIACILMAKSVAHTEYMLSLYLWFCFNLKLFPLLHVCSFVSVVLVVLISTIFLFPDEVESITCVLFRFVYDLHGQFTVCQTINQTNQGRRIITSMNRGWIYICRFYFCVACYLFLTSYSYKTRLIDPC